MKRMKMMVALLTLMVIALVAYAASRGPQRVTATLNGGAGVVVPPTGDTGRFTAQYMVFACAAGETQTVKYVTAGVTNTYGTKVVAANDAVLALTNMPPLFTGDRVLVSSSATGVTNQVTLIGELYD